MTTKERTNLNDGQLIREISIKYMLDALGYEQAVNRIKAVAARNTATQELADKTIKGINDINARLNG